MTMSLYEDVLDRFDYDPDTGVFRYRRGRSAGKVVSKISNRGYVVIQVCGKSYLAHRIAWLVTYGSMPAHTVDHIDGDRSNNRVANLRDIPFSEQHKNTATPVTNKSGVMGVCFTRNRWRAQIRNNGKVINLGDFIDFDAAVAARKSAERRYGYHENHGRDRAATT